MGGTSSTNIDKKPKQRIHTPLALPEPEIQPPADPPEQQDHSEKKTYVIVGGDEEDREPDELTLRIHDSSEFDVPETPRGQRVAQVGPYRMGEEIGKGAMGTVYRCMHTKTGMVSAMKRIPTKHLSPKDTNDIQAEIRFLQELEHKNVVSYKETIREEDYLNIVLEYVENGSLTKTCKKFGGRLPENLVSLFITQVLCGLEYLHSKKVIHRDIKGANILSTKDGVMKLADFGVATTISEFTKAHSVVGTPYWMAPEIISIGVQSTACDIWSVGCTTYELLTGAAPYFDLQAMPAMYNIVQNDHPPIPEHLSKLCQDFLLQCFEKDPLKRINATKLSKHPWLECGEEVQKQNEELCEQYDGERDEDTEMIYASIQMNRTKLRQQMYEEKLKVVNSQPEKKLKEVRRLNSNLLEKHERASRDQTEDGEDENSSRRKSPASLPRRLPSNSTSPKRKNTSSSSNRSYRSLNRSLSRSSTKIETGFVDTPIVTRSRTTPVVDDGDRHRRSTSSKISQAIRAKSPFKRRTSKARSPSLPAKPSSGTFGSSRSKRQSSLKNRSSKSPKTKKKFHERQHTSLLCHNCGCEQPRGRFCIDCGQPFTHSSPKAHHKTSNSFSHSNSHSHSTNTSSSMSSLSSNTPGSISTSSISKASKLVNNSPFTPKHVDDRTLQFDVLSTRPQDSFFQSGSGVPDVSRPRRNSTGFDVRPDWVGPHRKHQAKPSTTTPHRSSPNSQPARAVTSYKNSKTPKCLKCRMAAFKQESITAHGLTWHKRCFKCDDCSVRLSKGQQCVQDNTLYCSVCVKKMTVAYNT